MDRKITIDCGLSNKKDGLLELKNTYLASFSVLLYIVVSGMAISYSSPATVDMRKPGSRFVDVTQDQITWIASLPEISGCIGNCVAGYLSHKLGRRKVLLLISGPNVISWLMIAYAPTISWIYCGRLLTGFCDGVSSVAVPAYVIEIAPVRIRGFLASGYEVAYSVGIFVMVLLGYILRWSWLAVSGAIVVTSGAFLVYFMPESPAWLLRESRSKEAIDGLRFLTGFDVNSEKEWESMVENLQDEPKIAWQQFLDPVLYKPIMIAVILTFFQESSGITPLTAFSVEIFHNIGSSMSAQTSAVVFAAVQVMTTIFSSMVIDNVGRRFLYISSGILVTISLCILGFYTLLLNLKWNLVGLAWIPLASLIGYIAFFSLGFGPVPIVIIPEMIPFHSRSTVLAISAVSTSFFSFVVTKSYGYVVNHIQYYGLFWVYGTFTLMATLFGWFFLPETKGRTIKEINRSFSNYKSNNNEKHKCTDKILQGESRLLVWPENLYKNLIVPRFSHTDIGAL